MMRMLRAGRAFRPVIPREGVERFARCLRCLIVTLVIPREGVERKQLTVEEHYFSTCVSDPERGS